MAGNLASNAGSLLLMMCLSLSLPTWLAQGDSPPCCAPAASTCPLDRAVLSGDSPPLGSEAGLLRILRGRGGGGRLRLDLRGGGGGIPLNDVARSHYYDDEEQEVAAPAAARAPIPARGVLPEGDAILRRMEEDAVKRAEAEQRRREFSSEEGEDVGEQRRREALGENGWDREEEEGSVLSSEWPEEVYEAERLAPTPQPEDHDENYKRLVDMPDPEDFKEGDEGYNKNPFAGVRVKGWFMSEHTDTQSEDPRVRELNERLWDACDEGDADEALRLIREGAEVNAADPFSSCEWTALMHACAPPPAAGLPNDVYKDSAKVTENKRLDLVDCLVANGARVQVADIYGETPLHYAAVRGYPRLTRKLIELGVDLHRENMYGSSAQRIAEVNQKENPGCWEAAEVIAEAGGYDAGWPDARGIPEGAIDHNVVSVLEQEWERDYDPTGEKHEARVQQSLRRVERDTLLLAKRKLRDGEGDDDEDDGGGDGDSGDGGGDE